MSRLAQRVGAVLTWVPVGVLISDTVCTLQRMDSEAMSPTIPKGGVAVVSRSVRPSNLMRGDVVAFTAPDKHTRLLRRVLALPGDCVTKVDRIGRHPSVIVVPNGFVWLEGDAGRRYFDRYDSNRCGPLPVSLITGKAVMTLPSGNAITRIHSPRVIPPSRPFT